MSRSVRTAECLFAITLLFQGCAACAQSSTTASIEPNACVQDLPNDAPTVPIRTTKERWDRFISETVGPLTFGGAVFNAGFSQITNTDPKYGVNGVALAERFGASLGDIATQNFFGDFVVASAFHEDPQYYRKGEGHSLIYRGAYAVSRAVVIRKDNGKNGFNFDNILGSALSTGLSNWYYPPASRTRGAILMHFWIDIADNGFVNLAPEFWPDFRRKVLHWHSRTAHSCFHNDLTRQTPN